MTEKINLNKIRTDGGTQPRAELDEEVISEYAEQIKNGDQFPEVIIYNDGENYWLTDGFHRFHAHVEAGIETIKCRIKQGTRRDAILESVGVNAKHGLRRTNADKRRAVTKLLEDEEWGKWSDREIARQCGVSNDFVSRLRRDSLSSDDSQPTERTYTTRHGTEATMDISNTRRDKPSQPTVDENDILNEEEETTTPEEKPFEEWSESEQERREKVEKQGQTVVANMHKDKDLVQWAKKNGYYVRIDRMTKWGNPFEMPGDGDRYTVCDSYQVYFDLKYSLQKSLYEKGELTNKVLGCHCYPERCHGDFLKQQVADQPELHEEYYKNYTAKRSNNNEN